MKQRLTALRRRWAWLDRALDVQDRVREINGSFVASGITISVFISLFPLLLVGIAVLGFLNAGDADLGPRLIENLGLTGAAADNLTTALDNASNSRQMASIVGVLGLAWAGSGVAIALQHGVQAPWQKRPLGMKARLMGMAWLVAASIGFVIALALGGVLNYIPDSFPAWVFTVLSIIVGLAIQVGLFTWMFWGLGTRNVPVRNLLPGAIVAAVGFEILKLVGTVVVPAMISKSSSLYGSIGVVFATLAWLAIFARLLVYSSTLNAVLYEAAHGTVTVPVHVPRIADDDPIAATRGGVALEVDDKAPAVPATP